MSSYSSIESELISVMSEYDLPPKAQQPVADETFTPLVNKSSSKRGSSNVFSGKDDANTCAISKYDDNSSK